MNSSFWNNERLLKLVVFACVLVVLALTIVFKQQSSLSNQQSELDSHLDDLEDTQKQIEKNAEENKDRQRIVKAVACRIEFAIGLQSSASCVTPELLELWDPETSVSPYFGADRG